MLDLDLDLDCRSRSRPKLRLNWIEFYSWFLRPLAHRSKQHSNTSFLQKEYIDRKGKHINNVENDRYKYNPKQCHVSVN